MVSTGASDPRSGSDVGHRCHRWTGHSLAGGSREILGNSREWMIQHYYKHVCKFTSDLCYVQYMVIDMCSNYIDSLIIDGGFSLLPNSTGESAGF